MILEVLALIAVVLIYFKVRKLMTLVEEIDGKVDAVAATVAATDLKLDEVRARIAELVDAGSGATQEQLEALLLKVTNLATGAEAVLAETTEAAGE